MGEGPALTVGHGDKERLLVDGGGSCSPGLWPPGRRAPAGKLQVAAQGQIRLAWTEHSVAPTAILRRILEGGMVGSPFPQEAVRAARDGLSSLVKGKLDSWVPLGPPQSMLIEARPAGSLLCELDDPDWEVFRLMEAGVRIGVGVELPRTPSVFPEKRKWTVAGQEHADPDAPFVGTHELNYISAKDHIDEVEAALKGQEQRGQIISMAEERARREYGPRLAIASLGAVEKGTREDGTVEVRIVHDGTHGVAVNPAIKVLDHVPTPSASDIKTVIRHCAESGLPFMGLTADVKEAHRQIPVAPADWPLHACQTRPGGPVYLNKVGTYGISSAGYWWGRVVAALHRLAISLTPHALMVWLLLFADDWLVLAGGKFFAEGLLYPVFVLEVLGVPFSWKKLTAGLRLAWIGYEVDLRSWALGISERRAAWLLQWFDKVLLRGCVAVDELRQALGRMVYVYGALEWDRPFMAPLFTLLASRAAGSTPTIPPFVRAALLWLRERLRERRVQPCHRRLTHLEGPFRVDAKADAQGVAIGGWAPAMSPCGRIDVAASKWFATTLTPTDSPWAFVKGEAYKVIAALELLATVVALMVFDPRADPGELRKDEICVSGHTDSQVSSQVLGKGFTTSFPLCLLAMEAAAQLESRSMSLQLQWIPRGENEHADALANLRFGEFRAKHRIHVDVRSLPFLALPRLQAQALEFYKEDHKAAQKRAATSGASRRARKSARLRDTDPW